MSLAKSLTGVSEKLIVAVQQAMGGLDHVESAASVVRMQTSANQNVLSGRKPTMLQIYGAPGPLVATRQLRDLARVHHLFQTYTAKDQPLFQCSLLLALSLLLTLHNGTAITAPVHYAS